MFISPFPIARMMVFASLLVIAGCNAAALPKTYPARGSVVYKGGQSLKGGSIQFTSLTDPALRVVGPIQGDGTFTLQTVKGNNKADGAPAGEYRVQVLPPLQSDARGGVQGDHRGVAPIALEKTFNVEAKENEFRIELTVPPP